jgi:putative Mg2+ transporter-C (MgtC) family protein
MNSILAQVPHISGLSEAVDLLVALILSSLVGVERELRQKSAGLRTHTLVGVGAALFVLVSKFGFSDVLSPGHAVLDPSRMAAQIVTGIGFIGGGLIFVRRDIVRGLTTAAAVWLTAAIGAAAGAGLLALAAGATAAHFLVVYGYNPIVRRLPFTPGRSVVWLRYENGTGALRAAMEAATAAGFVVSGLSIANERRRAEVGDGGGPALTEVEVSMEVDGSRPVAELVSMLSDIDGVMAAGAGDLGSVGDSP